MQMLETGLFTSMRRIMSRYEFLQAEVQINGGPSVKGRLQSKCHELCKGFPRLSVLIGNQEIDKVFMLSHFYR